MPVRIDQIFQVTTGTVPAANIQRIGGWKEQLWFAGTNLTTALAAYRQVIPEATGSVQTLRLRLSPNTVKLIGLRLQAYTFSGLDLIPTGGMLPVPVGFAGTDPGFLDGSGSALEMRMGFTDVGRQIVIRIEGLPREQISGGEARFNVPYRTAVNNWLKAVSDRFGSVLLNPGGVTYQKISSITAEGFVTGRLRLVGLPAGATCTIRAALDACRRRRGKATYVLSVDVTNGTVIVAGWPWGACTRGTIYSTGRDFVTYDSDRSRFEKLVQRKLGGPFYQFRGHSRRKLRT